MIVAMFCDDETSCCARVPRLISWKQLIEQRRWAVKNLRVPFEEKQREGIDSPKNKAKTPQRVKKKRGKLSCYEELRMRGER